MTSVAISESRGAELAQRNRRRRCCARNCASSDARQAHRTLQRHYVEEWFGLELRRAAPRQADRRIMLDVDHFKRFNDSFARSRRPGAAELAGS